MGAARQVCIALSLTLAFTAACAPRPGTNLAMVQSPGHSWHGPIGAAAYAKSGQVTVELGERVVLVATCSDHLSAPLAPDGDSRVERVERGIEIAATSGKLDIAECSPQHLRAKVWARFPDGGRVDASIDTAMTAPAAARVASD